MSESKGIHGKGLLVLKENFGLFILKVLCERKQIMQVGIVLSRLLIHVCSKKSCLTCGRMGLRNFVLLSYKLIFHWSIIGLDFLKCPKQ